MTRDNKQIQILTSPAKTTNSSETIPRHLASSTPFQIDYTKRSTQNLKLFLHCSQEPLSTHSPRARTCEHIPKRLHEHFYELSATMDRTSAGAQTYNLIFKPASINPFPSSGVRRLLKMGWDYLHALELID